MKSYSEKLRDPKWQRKRLEILNRDDFTCVVCSDSSSELHVHHKKYVKGNDPWDYPNEALETRCADCHDAVHNFVPLNIYMAGKISKNGWRRMLVQDPNQDLSAHGPEIIKGLVLGGHNYCGPWFISCDHGCAHSDGKHGLHFTDCVTEQPGFTMLKDTALGEHCRTGRDLAFVGSMTGIEEADLVFAWIESRDCYGTLAEIGVAYAFGKSIAIGLAEPMDELWFVSKMDSITHRQNVFPDVVEAFNNLVLKRKRSEQPAGR